MQLTRCPSCHARIDLTSVVEDEAGRELLALVAKLQPRLAGPALAYLGLFRPIKQDLRNSRALTLLQETLALSSDQYLLTAALEQTVQQLQQKRQQGTHRPMTGHGYLKSVMAGIAERTGQDVRPGAVDGAPTTPTQIDEVATKRENERAYKEQMARFGYKMGPDGRLVSSDEETS